MKAFNEDGAEIEVFSADEVKAQTTAAVDAAKKEVEGQYAPKVTELEKELGGAKSALAARAGEFANFRKLSDEAVAKLDEAQRTIYNNGLILEEERKKTADAEKARLETQVDGAIRATAGTDEKLYTKMKSMFGTIAIEATTPEQIQNKIKMVVGAIGATEPDLVASVANFSGGFRPPVTAKAEGESFADTDKGKAFAKDIGLVIPEPKK